MTRENQLAQGRNVCESCGGQLVTKRQSYKYEECGLSNVTLTNIKVRVCKECGHESPEIPNLRGLHALIVMDVVANESPLTGEEVRFLRRAARLKAKELAARIGMSAVTVSRMEHGSTISPPVDRLIRLVCFQLFIERAISSGTVKVDHDCAFDALPKIREDQKSRGYVIDPALLQGESWPTNLVQ